MLLTGDSGSRDGGRKAGEATLSARGQTAGLKEPEPGQLQTELLETGTPQEDVSCF